MGRIAFVFAGQGAQAPGMGADICENSQAAAEVFKKADEIRPGTSALCFRGNEAELMITSNTQPCLYVTEMAIAAAVEEAGIKAEAAAGFSLGELSALTYGQAMDFETGLKLVMKRGAYMQEASEANPAKMAAVVKLTNEQVISVCSQFEHVYPVNFNCPGQVSVSGLAEEMDLLPAKVKEAGGRAIPLKVSGAFHSPFMNEAAAKFAKELENADLQMPAIRVFANFTGAPYGSNVKGLLSTQINNPVKWEDTIRFMIGEGFDTFVEIGPGKTLAGFIKKIDGNVKTYSVATKADLDACLAGVR